jgi:PAS domain-containing protein
MRAVTTRTHEYAAVGWDGAGYWGAAIGGARDAMLILDDQRRCVDANPAAGKLVGVAIERLIGARR